MTRRALAAALLSLATAAHGEPVDGKKLVDWMRDYEKVERRDHNVFVINAGRYQGYVSAVLDANTASYCAGGVPNRQVFSAVAKYLNDHPAQWHEPAHTLIDRALRQAFPCKP